MEFPTLVYRKGGKYQRPGGTFSTAPAANEEKLGALLKDGWFLSLPESINGKHNFELEAEEAKADKKSSQKVKADAKAAEDRERKESAEAEVERQEQADREVEKQRLANEEGPTREQMEAKAKEIGVKFGVRLGDDKLRERIEDKLKEMAAEE